MRLSWLVVAILASVNCAIAQQPFDHSYDILTIINQLLNNKSVEPKNVTPTLSNTFEALKTLLDYFWIHILELNVDAVFVTGMARDQLRVIHGKLDKYPVSSFASVSYEDVKNTLENLIQTADWISSFGIPLVSLTQRGYYDMVKRLLTSGFWNMDNPSKVTNPTLIIHPTNVQDIQGFQSELGQISDSCLSEVTTLGVDQMCILSEECWSAMTGGATSGYMLIHQVMYMEVVERMGCGATAQSYVAKLNQGSMGRLFDVFCAHAMSDVKLVETIEPTETYKQDIFMEEALLCGLAGYRDFFSKRWLSKILSWQKPSGCYGIFSEAERFSMGPVGIQIAKRQEKRLSDDCLTHKSAVATGVLSQYIRYLLEDPELSTQH